MLKKLLSRINITILLLTKKKHYLSQGYSLYLDDERTPKTNRDWIIVRSYSQFIYIIKKLGCPKYASFDNDLGTKKEGYDCAKWLVENNILIKEFNVHSANLVAAENIKSLLNNWIKFNKENISQKD